MKYPLKTINKFAQNIPTVFFFKDISKLSNFLITDKEIKFLKNFFKNNPNKITYFLTAQKNFYFVNIENFKDNNFDDLEKVRRKGNEIFNKFKEQKFNDIQIIDLIDNDNLIYSFIEGLLLSNYNFNKYKSKEETYFLKNINLLSSLSKSKEKIKELNNVVDAVYLARDLVNEPNIALNSIVLAEKIKEIGNKYNFSVKILNKSQIEELKMGGLLAVNKGSTVPPTFSILTWKAKNAINKKPYILVGKGIVFDTGGVNVKVGNYMTNMKSDMGGAAAVIGTFQAIASMELPVYVIGLIPATDNRPGGNAYVPGDVIKMHNGMTVEVLNTDAEGRMILADALSYARNFKPKLVIDLATLTGAAARAVSKYATVAMHNSKDNFKELHYIGEKCGERLVEFPLWDDYDELIKSKVADIKNIGGEEAGAITAGKFLEHFTDYKWIHLDIAGTAFLESPFNYRGEGGTGVGVRLLYHFFKNKTS